MTNDDTDQNSPGLISGHHCLDQLKTKNNVNALFTQSGSDLAMISNDYTSVTAAHTPQFY